MRFWLGCAALIGCTALFMAYGIVGAQNLRTRRRKP